MIPKRENNYSGNTSKTFCGDWCPVGWEDLVEKLHQDIYVIKPDYKIDQIKEKFGGLRYYIDTYDNDEIQRLIEEAEEKSYTICMYCGSGEGIIRKDNWIEVSCYECYGNSNRAIRIEQTRKPYG